MKLKLFLVLAIILFALSCEETNENIEILANHELEYLVRSEVDLPAKIGPSDYKAEYARMISIADEVRNNNSNFPNEIEFYLRLFVNEHGKVVAIKNLKPEKNENQNIQKEFISKLVTQLEDLTGTPAKKGGQNVKFRSDFIIRFEIDADTLKLSWPINLTYGEKFKSRGSELLNETEFLFAVEQMPEPKGGISAIAEKVRYPELAKRAGIEGRVFVKALIDEKGNVVGTQIIKGIGGGCDQAAIAAVAQTKFTPGKHKGKTVKVQVSIPILFKLQ